MKKALFIVTGIVCWQLSFAQSAKKYKPAIQPCDCHFKIDSSYAATAPPPLRAPSRLEFENTIDSSFKTQCGYLIVPENRKKANSRMIRLPFIVLKTKSDHKKQDPVLFTSGGPGNSSLGWINGMQKSSIIADRDCIAFEQRGTRFAIPYLRIFELDSTMKVAYRKNLPKDSMWMEGVKRYKKKLEQKGVDLAGYNSDETVADIMDLLTVLNIDSVNLMGGSYSGGLMTAVLQKDPQRVRSLVLDSPLPMFSPIDEDEPVHFNEALRKLSEHAEKDSADKALYGNLYARFQDYFNSILHKQFVLPILDTTTGQTLNVQYTRNELLDLLDVSMQNPNLKSVPFMITELINGNHEKYIRPRLQRVVFGWPSPDGMRMSVYCADQASYHNEAIIHQVYTLYPYMEGYHINDVWKAVCDCWKVPPVSATTKQPFHSAKPALIADGEMDPACSPLYILQLKHYLPNAQTFLFINRSHGVGGKTWNSMTQQFLDNPYQKIEPGNKDVLPY